MKNERMGNDTAGMTEILAHPGTWVRPKNDQEAIWSQRVHANHAKTFTVEFISSICHAKSSVVLRRFTELMDAVVS